MLKIEMIAETHDWSGAEDSAEKAREHMQATIDALSAKQQRDWVAALLLWDEGGEDTDAAEEIRAAQGQAELAGLEGWAEHPTGGHGVSIFVAVEKV